MKQTVKKMLEELKNYDGDEICLMEVCGSHTAAIARSGIRDLLSKKIRLVSGPGCPVCVTPSAYIDRLIEIAMTPGNCVVTFGDMLRVPGSIVSLSESQGNGANVKMVYSPLDTIKLAIENPDTQFVFAAVGFETTAPVYALLLEQILQENLHNIKMLTALKTMPPALTWLCENGAVIDGFIAPGHVSVITGSEAYLPLAKKYQIPFAVSGFQPEELVTAVYGLVKSIGKQATVSNYYPSVVTAEGNKTAQEKLDNYFKKADAVWRGMGNIPDSGLLLREEYQKYDAGSGVLTQDQKKNRQCCCDKVLMGRMRPNQCPLFYKECTPQNPQGACMVSTEGSCYHATPQEGR